MRGASDGTPQLGDDTTDATVHVGMTQMVERMAAATAHRWILVDDRPPHPVSRPQLLLVTGGRGVLGFSHDECQLQRGSLALIRADDSYSFSHCDDLELIVIEIAPDLFEHELAWMAGQPTVALLSRPRARTPRPVVDLLPSAVLLRAEIWAEKLLDSPSPGPGGRVLDVGYLTLLLGELASVGTLFSASFEVRPDLHPSVLKAMALLEQSLEVEWTLTSLAQLVNLAPAYLVRLFSRQLGVPPMAYLNRLRAERVGLLLVETELSIAAIGELVGWPDRSYVSRRFRAAFAISPADYRATFGRRAAAGEVKKVHEEVTDRHQTSDH